MDPVRMGKFLAQLRREAGLTQEALGGVLGVTNKTVSRWENGNYLPDLDQLEAIGARFGVSVDELIRGERAASPAKGAPDAARDASGAGTDKQAPDPFALAERIAYWKRKWRREHRAARAACVLFPALVLVYGAVYGKPMLCGGATLLALLLLGGARNRMMAYVEARAFGP